MTRAESPLESPIKALFAVAFGLSLALHGVSYAALRRRTVDTAMPLVVTTVSFDVTAPPVVEPQGVPQASRVPVARRVAPAQSRSAKAEAEALPSAAPRASVPVDLSGVTLTNEIAGEFAIPIGD